MSNINCIGYYEKAPIVPDTLRAALLNFEDGEQGSQFLNNIYYDADDHNTVYVDFFTVGPFGAPQSKHFFSFQYVSEQSLLCIDETFDRGEFWDWVSDDGIPEGTVYIETVDAAADFIREWIVSA